MNRLMTAALTLPLGLVGISGLYLLLKGFRNVRMALASTQWPPGTVIHSIASRPVYDESATGDAFFTQTLIRYAVNGQVYTTDLLHFGQTLGSSDMSEAALQRLRYPEGAPLSVYYNPHQPSTGVLRPGLHAAAFWPAGVALAFPGPVLLCLIVIPPCCTKQPRPGRAVTSNEHRAIEGFRSSSISRPHGDRTTAFAAALAAGNRHGADRHRIISLSNDKTPMPRPAPGGNRPRAVQ